MTKKDSTYVHYLLAEVSETAIVVCGLQVATDFSGVRVNLCTVTQVKKWDTVIFKHRPKRHNYELIDKTVLSPSCRHRSPPSSSKRQMRIFLEERVDPSSGVQRLGTIKATERQCCSGTTQRPNTWLTLFVLLLPFIRQPPVSYLMWSALNHTQPTFTLRWWKKKIIKNQTSQSYSIFQTPPCLCSVTDRDNYNSVSSLLINTSLWGQLILATLWTVVSTPSCECLPAAPPSDQ